MIRSLATHSQYSQYCHADCSHCQDSFHTLLQPKFLFKEPENVWRTSKIPTSIRAHFLFITQLVEDGLVKVLICILSVCNIVLGQHGTREGSGSRSGSTLILTSLHCASLIFICTERECGVSSMTAIQCIVYIYKTQRQDFRF